MRFSLELLGGRQPGAEGGPSPAQAAWGAVCESFALNANVNAGANANASVDLAEPGGGGGELEGVRLLPRGVELRASDVHEWYPTATSQGPWR